MMAEPMPLRCLVCHRALDDLRCASCGYEATVEDGIPVLLRDPDEIARLIAKARSAGRGAWFEDPHASQWEGPYRHHLAKRRRYLDDTMARHAPSRDSPVRALDLGCGDGEHLEWLQGWADQIVGSDYNLVRLRRAAERAPAAELMLADVTNHPAADESVDIVFFNHVIEHVPDDAAVLREVRRMLSPRGLCILGTPNEGAAFWRLAYRLQPKMARASDHVHHYTAGVLARRCEDAGLHVREIEHIGWGVPHWTLDAKLRGRGHIDDLLESVGRRWLPRQATSLYLTVSR